MVQGQATQTRGRCFKRTTRDDGATTSWHDKTTRGGTTRRPPNWVPEPVSMLPIPRDRVAQQECVGERATTEEVEILDQSSTKDRRVQFAVDEEVRGPTAEPTKQDRRAPIKMVSGRAWSLRIYQALRLLGKSLDVAWERAFIHPLTFN